MIWNIALVCNALFLYKHQSPDSWLDDSGFRIHKEGCQSLSNDQAIDP